MLRALLPIVVLTGAAHAQAPGQAPQGTLAPLDAKPSVMDRRWAISGGIGWQSMEVKTETGPEVTLGIIELAGRFRVARAVELGAVLVLGGAGGQTNAGQTSGGLTSGGIYLDARYRFLAERRWNIYAGLALGIATAADPEGPKEPKRGRGSLRVTVFGLERRFERFAIFGDVDVVGIAKNEDLAMPPMAPIAWQFSRHGLGGGAVTFGGTFYF